MEEATIIQMERHHVSRVDLQAMAVGQSIRFILPESGKMKSARSTCDQMKLEGMKFSCRFGDVSGGEYSVVIERLS